VIDYVSTGRSWLQFFIQEENEREFLARTFHFSFVAPSKFSINAIIRCPSRRSMERANFQSTTQHRKSCNKNTTNIFGKLSLAKST